MRNKIIKVWKDEDNRRWYLPDCDDFPYISSSTLVGIAKTYRYRGFKKDDKSAKRLQKAGQIGTNIHAVFEQYNRKQLGEDFYVDPKICTRYSQILLNYIKKVELISLNEGEVKVVEVERGVINSLYKYAGRFDVLVTVGGEYEIWDYKTSRQVKEEDGWQLASYMLALLLEGIKVKRVRIIHIDKISYKITDLKYRHHGYMIRKFLGLMDTFKGMYFNDLLRGRINDIDELGKKYKWPLDELLKCYVIDYNKQEENIMELQEVTGLGDKKTFVKDPNRVDFSDGEVIGTLLGAVPSRWVHKAGKKVFACTGKDKCERCKLGMKKAVQFKANFLTLDATDKPVIKYIVSESIRLFFALNGAMKEIAANDGDTRTAVIRIERSGTGYDTQYKVESIAPKCKALQNIAETIKDMEPHELTFDPLEDDGDQGDTPDRTDIVE